MKKENMKREEVIQKITNYAKKESLEKLVISMENISDKDLQSCLDTFEAIENRSNVEYITDLVVGPKNTISVQMEKSDGKYYGVTLNL